MFTKKLKADPHIAYNIPENANAHINVLKEFT